MAETPRDLRASRAPTIYIPHGGGPCFFMEWTMGPPDMWDGMKAFLEGLAERYTGIKAMLVISAHWEEPVPTIQTGATPPLLYDYYGFPPHTYELTWPAPGAPDVAERVRELLDAAGIVNATDSERGFDHGTFIPLKVAFPDAAIPTFQLSLRRDLDPAAHVALGRALAPLRDEGGLIIGSGMSFHNLRPNRPDTREASERFDAWLNEVVCAPAAQRDQALIAWREAPEAEFCHPREEHLMPLMVAAGAAGEDTGRSIYRDHVLSAATTAVEFG